VHEFDRHAQQVRALSQMMAVELRALRLEGACEKHVSAVFSDPWLQVDNSTVGTAPVEAGTLQDACIGLDTWAPNINLNRDPRYVGGKC